MNMRAVEIIGTQDRQDTTCSLQVDGKFLPKL